MLIYMHSYVMWLPMHQAERHEQRYTFLSYHWHIMACVEPRNRVWFSNAAHCHGRLCKVYWILGCNSLIIIIIANYHIPSSCITSGDCNDKRKKILKNRWINLTEKQILRNFMEIREVLTWGNVVEPFLCFCLGGEGKCLRTQGVVGVVDSY